MNLNRIGWPYMCAEEAASLISHGQTLGFSGFTPAGCPKVVPSALAERVKTQHAAGIPFKVGVVTGASTGPSLDGALAGANAIAFRTPYQSDPGLRKMINLGETKFFDLHLSTVAQTLRHGLLGHMHWGIIEAAEVNANGEVLLTSSVGISPTIARLADGLIIELNQRHPPELRGYHDCYEPADPPFRREIPVYKPSDRIGAPVITVDPRKIAGIVRTNLPDETTPFSPPNEVTRKIGENVANFLAGEIRVGRIPSGLLPIQSGVGNVANAVLGEMATHPDLPRFEMYTEVIQDSVIGLLQSGQIRFASGVSLTLTDRTLQAVYDDLSFFRSRLLLRPTEIANNPEIVRRLGLISINTALEVDVFGNVNSTHVMGKQLMNGIGGSGDFTRNAFLSIFTCPSVAKQGKISAIVPWVTHMDHSEHSVSVVVTEQGVADLRGTSPHERAALIVEKCAHPDFREELRGYFEQVKDGHTPHTLAAAFAMHQQYLNTGDMRGVRWGV